MDSQNRSRPEPSKPEKRFPIKAFQITGYGDIASNLAFAEVEKPVINASQVLIEVHAASVNPIDYKTVEGELKVVSNLSFPAPIGFDVAGKIVDVGPNVNGIVHSDDVYARVPFTAPGTFAEFIAVDQDAVPLKPENLKFAQAASLPLVGLTAVQSLEMARLKSGDKVLIHAGSGGVGSFAVQYAKHMGAYVYTTASTKNVERVKALGTDRVIDYGTEDYRDIVRDLDLVFDTLGGDYTIDAFGVIKKGGHVVSIAGEVDGQTAKELGLNALIRAVLWFNRRKIMRLAAQKSASYRLVLMEHNGAQLARIKDLFEAGDIKPVLDPKDFPFDQAVDALLYQKSGRAQGKIVIRIK